MNAPPMLRVTVAEGVGEIVLDNPPLNILTQALMAEMRAALAKMASDRTLRVLILWAEGKHFSAGASVEEHLPGAVETMIPDFMETIRALSDFPVPVVVAVHGRCLGGGFELALAGDLVVAGESALLGVPEINLGVIPLAACVQIPRLSTPGVAAELVFTGAPIDAATALAAGLILRVVSDEGVLDEARSLTAAITRHSAVALRAAKKALGAGSESRETAFGSVTRLYLEDLMNSSDATEGLRSFMEKREPQWSHS